MHETFVVHYIMELHHFYVFDVMFHKNIKINFNAEIYKIFFIDVVHLSLCLDKLHFLLFMHVVNIATPASHH